MLQPITTVRTADCLAEGFIFNIAIKTEITEQCTLIERKEGFCSCVPAIYKINISGKVLLVLVLARKLFYFPAILKAMKILKRVGQHAFCSQEEEPNETVVFPPLLKVS